MFQSYVKPVHQKFSIIINDTNFLSTVFLTESTINYHYIISVCRRPLLPTMCTIRNDPRQVRGILDQAGAVWGRPAQHAIDGYWPRGFADWIPPRCKYQRGCLGMRIRRDKQTGGSGIFF